jgi:hypothetical protein
MKRAPTCRNCGTPLLRVISRERGICSECHSRQKFPRLWAEYDKRHAEREQP